jgi:tetratricopeptide (TPR) repeat protein
MKQLLAFVFFLSIIQSGFAQGNSNSIDKFTAIVKESENRFVNNGGTFDSASVIQLLQIAQQIKNDSLLAISYNWIGSYLAFDKGNNVAALEYYFKAIPLAEKSKDKRRISSLYFDIALVYFAIEDNNKAGENLRKGGENLPDPSSSMYNFMLVQYQRNMAQYFLNANHPDSALHYAQAALETSRLIGSISFEHGSLYLTGDAYARMGDKEMAEISFKRAKALNDSIKLSSTKVPFFTGYVSFLLSSGRVAEAYQESKELLGIAVKENNDNIKLAADSLLRNVFDAMHRVDSAYYFSKLEKTVSASIFSHDNINKVQSLAFNEQLRGIEEKAKQDEEKQTRKENLQYVLIAIGIIVLLFVYLLLSHRLITNTGLIRFFGIIALLIIFEFLNLLLHPFLERITSHSPVLMLMSLVCIAALLVPLHHKLEKWAIAKLIDKNKRIRLAAARRTIAQLDEQ